jgi:hypothetical protein
MEELQKSIWVRALDCLYQFILGPRQPNTPKSHPWHFDKLVENKACVRADELLSALPLSSSALQHHCHVRLRVPHATSAV